MQLILVWTPGKGSPIHDHANAHCVMKVNLTKNPGCFQLMLPQILKGSLMETIYEAPQGDLPLTPKVTKETVYTKEEVAYISDKIGVHKISNASEKEVAVSLHLYTPPHAANFGFNLYCEKTGKPTHIDQTIFFSNRGERLGEAIPGNPKL